MCTTESRVAYAPRRLVAFAAGSADSPGLGGGASPEAGGPAGGPEPPRREPVPGSALRNWRQPMPFRQKWHLGVKNVGIKIKNHTTCCGNYGEPGC